MGDPERDRRGEDRGDDPALERRRSAPPERHRHEQADPDRDHEPLADQDRAHQEVGLAGQREQRVRGAVRRARRPYGEWRERGDERSGPDEQDERQREDPVEQRPVEARRDATVGERKDQIHDAGEDEPGRDPPDGVQLAVARLGQSSQ